MLLAVPEASGPPGLSGELLVGVFRSACALCAYGSNQQLGNSFFFLLTVELFLPMKSSKSHAFVKHENGVGLGGAGHGAHGPLYSAAPRRALSSHESFGLCGQPPGSHCFGLSPARGTQDSAGKWRERPQPTCMTCSQQSREPTVLGSHLQWLPT